MHSIDVILGFSKDQDPMLNSVGADSTRKMDPENMLQGKQVPTDPYAPLPALSDSQQPTAFQGEYKAHGSRHVAQDRRFVGVFLFTLSTITMS